MKNKITTFVSLMVLAALRPVLHFADGGAQGMGGVQEGLDPQVPAYAFRDHLRNIITEELTTSDVVALNDEDAGTEEGTPVFGLAESITSKLEAFFYEKGIDATSPLWNAIDGPNEQKGGRQQNA